MNKNYLNDIPVARQLDIITNVVAHYGHRTEIVVDMVKDGYKVTLELLELLYRLRSSDTIERILPYIEGIRDESFLKRSEMRVIEKALGKERALTLRQGIINRFKAEEDEKKRQEKEHCLARLHQLYQDFGLTEGFFEGIISSHSLMDLALEKYDRKTVVTELAKYDNGYVFVTTTIPSMELVDYGFYDIVGTKLILHTAEQQNELFRKMAQTFDGAEYLIDLYKSNRYRKNIVQIAKDKDVREKFKTLGHYGYCILHETGTMTEKEFEVWCKIEPYMVVFRKEFKKSLRWVIRNGYFKEWCKTL